MTHSWLPTILTVFMLGSAFGASAQSTGRVSGRVLDQTGAVLPGVSIDLVVSSLADVHTHPALPRSARIGIQFAF